MVRPREEPTKVLSYRVPLRLYTLIDSELRTVLLDRFGLEKQIKKGQEHGKSQNS